MAITKDKLASLAVFAVVAALAVIFLNPSQKAGIGLLIAVVISLPGLTLIWFAEHLAEVGCFSRGLARPSPPALVGFFGWLFLIGYPVLLVFVVRSAAASGG